MACATRATAAFIARRAGNAGDAARRAGAFGAGKPIPVPPGEVSVGADGALSVAGGAVATVGVFTFPAGTELTAGRRQPLCRAARAPSRRRRRMPQCTRARSKSANQDVVQGSLDLIVMQRQAEMMQKALTVFHTEFNKFATEDLPRV